MKVIPLLGTVVWLGADHLKTQSHLSIRISGSVISLTLLINTFIQRVPFSHQGLFRRLTIPIEKRDSRYCRSWILVSSFSCGGTWCLDQIVDNAPNTSVYLLVSVVGIIHVLPLVPYSPPSIWWEHLATIMKVWGGLWRSTSGVPSRLETDGTLSLVLLASLLVSVVKFTTSKTGVRVILHSPVRLILTFFSRDYYGEVIQIFSIRAMFIQKLGPVNESNHLQDYSHNFTSNSNLYLVSWFRN